MAERSKTTFGAQFLVAAASFVIIIAGMKAAQNILVPFLLALFIAILCTPLLAWLRKKKIPNVPAVIIILIGIIIVGMILAAVVGNSVSDFANNLPTYQAHLNEKMGSIITFLKKLGIDFSTTKLDSSFNPASAMKTFANMLTGLSGMLSNAFIIMLTIIFILMEAAEFPAKLQAALRRPKESLSRLKKVTESINRYMAIKTMFSFITAVLITVWLWILGVDYPLLWGLLAFLLNFIPNIGSIIAAVPAVLLAFIQLGPGSALLTTLGYVVVNIIIGSVLEPRFMGRRLGLSTLIVFLSLIFWGWVLGPIGMILSVPLTVIIKIALESDEDKRWISTLMGSSA